MSLNWSGISIKACKANAAWGFRAVDIILWNSTNWKLSNLRWGSLSSKSSITSHGPSPTPTITIDSGHFDASTIAFTVSLSLVTWPSATITKIWYCKGRIYLLKNCYGYSKKKTFHFCQLLTKTWNYKERILLPLSCAIRKIITIKYFSCLGWPVAYCLPSDSLALV